MGPRDAALALSALGLPVLPLLPHRKRPRHVGAYKDATTDVDQITKWWSDNPHDNIGVRPPPGMVVVDIDPRNGGHESMARLVSAHGRLPETWVARTGSGGWHYWFTVDGLPEMRSQPFDGVDIKHHGNGYVVVPPSQTTDLYEWLTPPGGEPAAAPGWLRLALVPKPYMPPPPVVSTGGGQFSPHCLVARINGCSEGQRNKTLFGALKDARRQGDLDAFEPQLVDAALARGLPRREIDAVIRSVRRS